MRRYLHETCTTLDPNRLYRAIADVGRWPEWDDGVESVAVGEPLRAGSTFRLKPKGGPAVRMEVQAAEAGRRFVDIAHLPFVRMRTSHEFLPGPDGTLLRVVIEVEGPLAFLWDRLVARPQAAGAEAQTRSFLQFAEALA